jgi:hypothetical protein
MIVTPAHTARSLWELTNDNPRLSTANPIQTNTNATAIFKPNMVYHSPPVADESAVAKMRG